MLFTIASLFLIAVATGYLLLFILRTRHANDTAASLAIFAVTVLSGAAFGIVAVQALEYRFGLALAASGLFAAAAGVCLVKRMGIAFAVNVFLAGALGGVGGVAFGMLLALTSKVAFVADVLIVVLFYLLQKTFERRAAPLPERSARKAASLRNPGNQASRKRTRLAAYAPTFVLAVLVIAAVTFLAMDRDSLAIGQIGRPAAQSAVLDEDNNLQTAVITVNASGFNPPNTSFTAGTMAKVIFRGGAGAGKNLTLVSDALGIDAPLKPGDNVFVIKKPLAGSYAYRSATGSLAGTFTITASPAGAEAASD